jgi:RNA-directed DNA polymerase
MLTLVELISDLRALAAADAPDLARINELFADPRMPAEYQVARHYIASQLYAAVETQLDSLVPRDRKAAIETARLVFPQNVAARTLRRVVRDPDRSVRSIARNTARKLGLAGIAPPELRATDRGRFSTTSWAFGILPTERVARAPKAPSRPKLDVPAIANVGDLAKLLGVKPDELDKLMRPGTQPGSAYIEFEIPKAKGGTRRIAAPRMPLRRVQRAILDKILAKVPMHDACHGFVAGRSTVTNATPHVGAALVLKVDLRDFFPTVHYRRVRGLFRWLGYSETVANALAGLTTYRAKLPDGTVAWPGVLPQGAPTSPALANLACRRLDQRLSKLAAKCGATYTRYADDLTFSFAKPPEVRIGRFLWWIDAICDQEGFLERPDKRRVLRPKHQQRVTGIVVNEGVHVPRADKKRFRAIVHNCKKHGVDSQAKGRPDFRAYLAGYAAYLHMVEPQRGATLVAEVEELLRG